MLPVAREAPLSLALLPARLSPYIELFWDLEPCLRGAGIYHMTRQESDSVTWEPVLAALVATAVCLSLHVEQKVGRTSEKVSLGNGLLDPGVKARKSL